jgi:hypothetical protein
VTTLRKHGSLGLQTFAATLLALLASPAIALADWGLSGAFLPCLGGVLHASPDGATLVFVGPDGAARTLHTLDRDDVWALDRSEPGACSPDGRWAILYAGVGRGLPIRIFRVSAGGVVEIAHPAGYDFDSGPIVLHGTELVISARTMVDRYFAILWGDLGKVGAGGAVPFVSSDFGALAIARTPAGTVREVYPPLYGELALNEIHAGGDTVFDRYTWIADVDEAELSPDGATVVIADGRTHRVVALLATDTPPDLAAGTGRSPRVLVDPPRVPLFPAGDWSSFRFSPDGRRFAAFDERPGKKPVTRLFVAEGLRALPGPVSFAGTAEEAAVDPALRVLATRARGAPGSRGWIDLLAVPGGKRLRRLTGLAPTVPARDGIAFSPDGATLFFTRSTITRLPAGPAERRHLTQELWAVPVKGGVPRRLARIVDRDELLAPGDE